jgi:cytochrome P450
MRAMSATPDVLRLPPLAEPQFDIGAEDNVIPLLTELFARHGDIYRFYSPGRREDMWVINHPDDVKRVLVGNHRNYTKGSGLERVRILLGDGIMTSEGDLWKRQRYMMQPSFHRRVITGFAELIHESNDRFIAKWEAQAARGELVNVTDDMSELTLEIVLKSIFGADLERLTREMGANPFELVTRETARDLKFAYQFRQLTKLVSALIARRRTERADHFDFLAMLMDARDKETGAPMTERELIDEVMTLIVAGHETTAAGLNWVWYLLSRNPAAEDLLHAEIDSVPEQAAPAFAELEKLEYTKNVVDEARAARSSRTRSPATRSRRAPTCCCVSIYFTGTRGTGKSRRPSGRSGSTPSTRPSGHASPTCRSPRARATASARRWPYMKCTCTYIRWRAATG